MVTNYKLILQELKSELLKMPIKQFSFEKVWMEKISNEPGVYVFYIDNTLIYIGESGNLQARMKDLRNTQNHSLRRLLGEKLFSNDTNYWNATSRKKFHPEIELKLEEYMAKNLFVQLLPVVIGRKEVEECLTSELEGLLNKRLKRK